MAKDYNIDDILSEVKQRRAEQESNLKAAPAPKAAPVQTDANREAYAGKLVEELLGPEKPAVKPEPKEKKQQRRSRRKQRRSPPQHPGRKRSRSKKLPLRRKPNGRPQTRRTQGRHCRCAGAAGAPQAATPPPAYENRDRTVTPDKPSQKPENQPPLGRRT